MSGPILVSKQWLLARMYEPDIVIVDCRFDLGRPEAGREDYTSSHIPGAVYLDLNTDLSAPVKPMAAAIRCLIRTCWRNGSAAPASVTAAGSSLMMIRAGCMPRGCGGCCAGSAMTPSM